MNGATYFRRAQGQLRSLKIAEALRLFNLAEQAGCDPDPCAAQRWRCHMLNGQFELAWRESEAIAARGRSDPNRFWDGRQLGGQSILVRCLHGLGDTIQFIRYWRLIRKEAKYLVIEAQPGLKALLQQAGIADQVITWGEPEPHWDQQIEIIEIPRIFKTTVESIPGTVPYLDIPSVSLAGLYDGTRPLRVGLVWAAGSHNPARSIAPDCLARLFAVRGVSFFSLQGAADMQQLAPYWHQITNLEEASVSVLAAARALKNLDLVISVDTMMAHLAGAMGRPVWTLLPYECDWRWMLEREDSPWYPTMRLFRQREPGDWDSVIQRVRKELEAQITCRLDASQPILQEQYLAREA